MRSTWKWLLVVLFASCLAVGGLFEFLLSAPATDGHKRLFVIQPGSGVNAVAKGLERQGFLRSDVAFSLWLRSKGWDRSIKAGLYALSSDMGARGIAAVLVSGKGEAARMTIPEGFSLRQVAGLLESSRAGSGQAFLDLASKPGGFQDEYSWLSQLPAGATLEGFLFPDTYVVLPSATMARDLIGMMLARFEQVALPAYQGADARLSLLQAVTLASIVEKEARHAEERPLIAGVFFNRLAARIPLGSDPTVEYALRKHQGAAGLSLRDVAVDSPYNTYKYAGLPPGPIANPGIASLKAVLSPAQTSYLYFVARGDGTHAFTRTYAEHLAAIRGIVARRGN